MDELIQFLQKKSKLPFSPALVQHLKSIIEEATFKNGGELLSEGQVCRNIYFIKKGLLRCYYKRSDKGGQVTTWVLEEENVVVSVQSFYDQIAGIEIIEALEDTDVYYITSEQLEQIYIDFPEFNYVGRVLTIEYLKFWNMQLYNLRMRNKEERFKLLFKSKYKLFTRVPQNHLASYLDMTAETFSRLKRKLWRNS